MAGKRTGRAADIVFEGVVIPSGTRSSKLAEKGIATTEEMSAFLTAVFADTLNGKIVLPPPKSPNRLSAKMLRGLEQKLSRGIAMKIQASGARRNRRSKTVTNEPQ